VLAHVDSVEDVITKVARLLKPGGRAVFELNDSDQLVSRLQSLSHQIQNRVGRSPGYSLNRTTVFSVRAAAERSGLGFLDMRRAAPTLFRMGRLPLNWLVAYEMFTLRHAALAPLCSEAILMFEKYS
jgi:hypothetical protein